ncbi:MAG TPA: hypothetical protein VHS31_12105 [Tepidisphaeraceae bacterium]|nr:hypothetical protein [Tepidisphaeraceae bacterium]
MKQTALQLGWSISAVTMLLLLASAAGQPRLDGQIDQTTRENAAQLWRQGPKLSPFSAVRWQETTPQVQVNGTWYELIALNDLPVAQIVNFCQQIDSKDWQKRFQEDLPAVLMLMGTDPGTSVNLALKDLQSG